VSLKLTSAKPPSRITVFEEMDLIARGGYPGDKCDAGDRMLKYVLTEMGGMDTKNSSIAGTTNRPDQTDIPLHLGRLDQLVYTSSRAYQFGN
jgi:SpoVK/Ycf46/Vps4 family AAA+-type ATPase